MAQGKLLSRTIRTFSNFRLNFRTSIAKRKFPVTSSILFDTRYGGKFRVPGTVAIAGTPDVPVVRKVRLIDRRSGVLARDTWSDAGGNYLFLAVSYGPWTVVSLDNTNEYNAVIADNIYGEQM